MWLRQLPMVLLTAAACAAFAAVWSERPAVADAVKNSKWWSLHRSQFKQADGHDVSAAARMFTSSQWRHLQPKGCQSDSGMLRAVLHGVHNALRECERQMATERWNCSRFAAHYREPNIFGRLLYKGFPETAFVLSIVSAGVTSAIASECRRSIACCPCKKTNSLVYTVPKEPGSVVAPACDHNVRFARSVAKGLLDRAEKGRDTRILAMLHNYNSGRRAVARSMKSRCLCHGPSGSCSYQTCWKQVADFKQVGQLLKEKYNKAVLVTRGGPVKMYVEVNSRRGQLRRKRRRRLNIVKVTSSDRRAFPKRSDLVYYERPPRNFYCERKTQLGVLGTRRRVCSAHNGNCDHICCGRRHVLQHYTHVDNKCNCQFVWCCEVKCETCVTQRTRRVCE